MSEQISTSQPKTANCTYCGVLIEVHGRDTEANRACKSADCKRKQINFRNKKRNDRIKQVLQDSGWKGQSELLTAIVDGVVACPVKPQQIGDSMEPTKEGEQTQLVIDEMYGQYLQVYQQYEMCRAGETDGPLIYWQGKKDGYRLAMILLQNHFDIKPFNEIDVEKEQNSSMKGYGLPSDVLRALVADAYRMFDMLNENSDKIEMDNYPECVSDMLDWLVWSREQQKKTGWQPSPSQYMEPLKKLKEKKRNIA